MGKPPYYLRVFVHPIGQEINEEIAIRQICVDILTHLTYLDRHVPSSKARTTA